MYPDSSSLAAPAMAIPKAMKLGNAEAEGNVEFLAPSAYLEFKENAFCQKPNGVIHPKLPSGVYHCEQDNNGRINAIKTVNVHDSLFELPIKIVHDVLHDLRTFWGKAALFSEFGLLHKRGLLLHGPPGSGKTSLLNLIQRQVIAEQDAIVMTISSQDQVWCTLRFLKETIRPIEPIRPVIIIYEDIDVLLNDRGSSVETTILQMLDGSSQFNHVINLATTNYPERLAERILNRPSRFDRVYHLGYPDAAVREAYLRHVIPSQALPKVNMSKWLKSSAGFTFAHLRDMVVSILVLGNDFDQAVTHLSGLKKLPTSAKSASMGVGFGKGGGVMEDMSYFPSVNSGTDSTN